MTNKLIESFLKLHSLKTGNIFEAAKKVKKLDPVGKEDDDVDNDGVKNDPNDKYIMNRRKAISKAMKNEATDPNAELDAPSSGGKAPATTTNPDWLKKMKPQEQTPNRAEKGSLPKGVTVKANEEVDFSEAELAHIAAILEANPVSPTPYDTNTSFGKGASRSGTLTDEAIAEEEAKRGRGRPKGSKSGARTKSGGSITGESETKNLAAQIRFASATRANDGKGNMMLKHPKTGVTKAVPAKDATEFYNKYSNAEKPAEKQAHHDAFVAKHFGNQEKPKTSGITLPKIPSPKS